MSREAFGRYIRENRASLKRLLDSLGEDGAKGLARWYVETASYTVAQGFTSEYEIQDKFKFTSQEMQIFHYNFAAYYRRQFINYPPIGWIEKAEELACINLQQTAASLARAYYGRDERYPVIQHSQNLAVLYARQEQMQGQWRRNQPDSVDTYLQNIELARENAS